ncbi:MAG: GAK system XXXCH domain-containing protein [Desulfonatronovibrionaceae bacterium]
MHCLSKSFDLLEARANENTLPEPNLVGEFLRCARQMQMEAPEEWAFEAEDFAHLADQLHKAVKNSDLHTAVQLINSLKDAQFYCHDELIK